MDQPQLIDAAEGVAKLMGKEFVGSIEIRIFKGGVPNVNVKQSVKNEREGSKSDNDE